MLGSRRSQIGAFVAVATAVVLSLVWASTLATPGSAAPTVSIASAVDLEVDHGFANSVVFPFQLAPNNQPNEEGVPTISSASASISVSEPACLLTSTVPCPGVEVAVYTADQVSAVAMGQSATPLWCSGPNTTSCADVGTGSFQVDLTGYAGQPLDLLVSAPSGVAWVDISATGTWSN